MLLRSSSNPSLPLAGVPAPRIPHRPRSGRGPQALLAALLLSIAGPGCVEKSCTEIGCVNGVTLDLTPAGGWKPGTYRFEIDIDGAVTTCEGSLPLAPCTSGPQVTCTPGGNRVRITESGCALPAGQHQFSQIHLSDESAKSVAVKVSRNGTELVQKTFAPKYLTSQPNGPGCPGICTEYANVLEIPNVTP